MRRGELRKAEGELRRLAETSPQPLAKRFEFELERIRRMGYEYPYTVEEAFRQLRKRVEDLTLEEFASLISRGCVDHAVIEGEVRVHRRFEPNAFWLCGDLSSRRKSLGDERSDLNELTLKWRAERVLSAAREKGGGYVLPLRYRVRARVSLKRSPRELGEPVRVWIPLPRVEGIHSEFRLLDYSVKPVHVAPPDHPQRTAYFELYGDTREVWVEYEFTSRGFHVEVDPREASVDPDSEVARRYLSERPPHIAFTGELREFVDRLTRGAASPYEKVQRIWGWITENVRYTYAKDYIFYDNIPEYVFREKRGDCGMQALLFITMCRIAGVPARWESGWYMHPLSPGMHDWAQFYLEPYGWLYADPSFGNKRKGGEWRNTFYLGSTEGYRLASNIEVYAEFDPPKRYIRSDPVDSQRGEVETPSRNLYYDEWDFALEIVSVEKLA